MEVRQTFKIGEEFDQIQDCIQSIIGGYASSKILSDEQEEKIAKEKWDQKHRVVDASGTKERFGGLLIVGGGKKTLQISESSDEEEVEELQNNKLKYIVKSRQRPL